MTWSNLYRGIKAAKIAFAATSFTGRVPVPNYFFKTVPNTGTVGTFFCQVPVSTAHLWSYYLIYWSFMEHKIYFISWQSKKFKVDIIMVHNIHSRHIKIQARLQYIYGRSALKCNRYHSTKTMFIIFLLQITKYKNVHMQKEQKLSWGID